jgi:hypothetical protein
MSECRLDYFFILSTEIVCFVLLIGCWVTPKVHGQLRYVPSLVEDAATIRFDSPLKSTQLEGHIEACVTERREFALNGDGGRWMERVFNSLFLWDGHSVVAAGDVVQDSLDEDDADMDAAGDVGEVLGEQIVDGVESVTGEDRSTQAF